MRRRVIVGVSVSEEIEPGLYVDKIVEKSVKANITTIRERQGETNTINTQTVCTNTFELTFGKRCEELASSIMYVKWLGINRRIQTIMIKPPKVIITVGNEFKMGVVNE